MELKDITIEDQSLLDSYLKKHSPQASELIFTNLFMWRHYYQFKYCFLHDLLCILAFPKNGEPFMHIPLGGCQQGHFTEAILQVKEYFRQNGWTLQIKKVTEAELECIKKQYVGNIEIQLDRDNSDYLYLTEQLISLQGKSFHAKRNHINKFKSLYTYEYVQLTQSLVEDCIRVMEQWCAQRDCECQRGDYCEKYANMEVLRNLGHLNCKGALVKVNGIFEAFTIGEMLNDDTAVIHIEKANFDIQGLYTWINQQFCEHEWRHCTYINREQDLGKERLRKAKLSYNPIKMIDKYTVLFK